MRCALLGRVSWDNFSPVLHISIMQNIKRIPNPLPVRSQVEDSPIPHLPYPLNYFVTSHIVIPFQKMCLSSEFMNFKILRIQPWSSADAALQRLLQHSPGRTSSVKYFQPYYVNFNESY